MRYLIFAIIIFALGSANAQSQSSFKRTTATILFSSIGGGVLGLSTLSFYGKPQEHTDNITTGVLVGFVAGLSYVMYDNYGQNQVSIPLNKNHMLATELDTLQNKKVAKTDWPLLNFNYNW